jgi:hypothetical protein
MKNTLLTIAATAVIAVTLTLGTQHLVKHGNELRSDVGKAEFYSEYAYKNTMEMQTSINQLKWQVEALHDDLIERADRKSIEDDAKALLKAIQEQPR